MGIATKHAASSILDEDGPPPLVGSDSDDPDRPVREVRPSRSSDEGEGPYSPGEVIRWIRELQRGGFHFQWKHETRDIVDGFRELGPLPYPDEVLLAQILDESTDYDEDQMVLVNPKGKGKAFQGAAFPGYPCAREPRGPGSRDEEPPLPLFVVNFWVRVSNAVLWLKQKHCSAQGLRDLWSSFARLGNKLRKSHWEAYRRELGYVVNKNRKKAPKAKPGPAAQAALVYEDDDRDGPVVED